MRRWLFLAALLLCGMGHNTRVAPCAHGDRRCLAKSGALLDILKGGPTSAQMAAGTLTTATGVSVTDTRASNVYCANSSGVLVLLSNNQPCVEGAFFGASAGLRVEGSATNTILQSNTFATTWAASTITVAAPTATNNTTDVTDPAGTNTASKIVYPQVVGAGALSAMTQGQGVTATAWSGSVYLRTLSGSATVYIFSTPNGVTYVRTACSVTSSWSRCTLPNTTLTAATWTYGLGVDLRDASHIRDGESG